MTSTLNSELSYATATDSTANKPTKVQEWDVPDGSALRLDEGHALIADFVTTAGNAGPAGASADPSRSTRFGLGYVEPNTPLDVPEIFCEFSVSPFNQLSLKDQQSNENAQKRTLRFIRDKAPNGSITAEDSDKIVLYALGPDEVDGSEITIEYPMMELNR